MPNLAEVTLVTPRDTVSASMAPTSNMRGLTFRAVPRMFRPSRYVDDACSEILESFDRELMTWKVVETMSEGLEHPVGGAPHASPRGRALLDKILQDKNVQPIQSADDLACDGLFETDEELVEFLTYTYSERRANVI